MTKRLPGTVTDKEFPNKVQAQYVASKERNSQTKGQSIATAESSKDVAATAATKRTDAGGQVI